MKHFVFQDVAFTFWLAVIVATAIVVSSAMMATWFYQDLDMRGEDAVSKGLGLGVGASLIAGAVCWVGIIFSEHPFLDDPAMGIELPLAFWLEIACFAGLMLFFVLLRLNKGVTAGKTAFTTWMLFAFVSAFALYADYDTWASRRILLLMSAGLKAVSLSILYSSLFHNEETPDERGSADISWEE